MYEHHPHFYQYHPSAEKTRRGGLAGLKSYKASSGGISEWNTHTSSSFAIGFPSHSPSRDTLAEFRNRIPCHVYLVSHMLRPLVDRDLSRRLRYSIQVFEDRLRKSYYHKFSTTDRPFHKAWKSYLEINFTAIDIACLRSTKNVPGKEGWENRIDTY